MKKSEKRNTKNQKKEEKEMKKGTRNIKRQKKEKKTRFQIFHIFFQRQRYVKFQISLFKETSLARQFHKTLCKTFKKMPMGVNRAGQVIGWMTGPGRAGTTAEIPPGGAYCPASCQGGSGDTPTPPP